MTYFGTNSKSSEKIKLFIVEIILGRCNFQSLKDIIFLNKRRCRKIPNIHET